MASSHARLAHDIALVTGATGSLGMVIARRLAEEGAAVAVHGRDATAVSVVVDGLSADGHRVAGFTADLGQGPDGCARLLDDVTGELGQVTVLVNNAANQEATVLTEPVGDVWRRIAETNILAAAELTRLVARSSPDARIVQIASVEGLVPFPGHAAYAASKAALLSLTAAMAAELAPARVNAVLPGLIDRPGLPEQWPAGYDWWCDTAPLGRPVSAEEVVAAVIFLASRESSGVTGAQLVVDNGWSASARTAW